MDDDTAEVRKIKTFADLRVVRDLNVILVGLTCESPVKELVSYFAQELEEALSVGDVVIVELRSSHQRDIVKLRSAPLLLQVCSVNVLGTSGIAGVPEQITVYNVL